MNRQAVLAYQDTRSLSISAGSNVVLTAKYIHFSLMQFRAAFLTALLSIAAICSPFFFRTCEPH